MNDSNRQSDETSNVGPALGQSHAAALSIIFGIMLAMFLSALEQTIVAPALPTMGRVLGDVENLSWVVTAYLISATVATPLFGKLSDIYGRRRMMLISIGIFIAGSLGCAVAPTVPLLIAGRALQGLGGGGLLPLAQTVIADLLSPRERPIVQGYSSTMFMAASIIGPVLGGFFTDHLHWSLIFWINLPLGVAALVMTDRALRRLPRNDRPHRLDLVGAAAMVAATVVLLLALSWGGIRYPWISLPIGFLFGASALLWIGFWWRLIRAPEPFIPLSVLREPVICGIVIAGFFSIGTIIGLSIFIPLYIELVLGLSASASGIVLIGFMGGATLGSLLAGRLIVRVQHYKRVPVYAAPLAVVVLVLLAIWPSGWSLVAVTAFMTLAGIGMGPMYPTTTVIVQNAVLPHQFGIATGTLNFFRSLGGAIIVAAFAAIVLSGLDVAVPGGTLDKMANAGASASELAQKFRLVFVAAAFFLGLACIAVAVIEERPLGGPYVRAREPE
ncbi:MAG TPA: MDR family MFS transporter [Xanthobacteraceae bacterium]|nr:MDR family MFS transporter [Xanthobacteraceae bacterium]